MDKSAIKIKNQDGTLSVWTGGIVLSPLLSCPLW